jgi:hypothetical protein
MRDFATRIGLAVVVLGLAAGRVRADVTIDIEQVGNDVVATGSGSLDLRDWRSSSRPRAGSASYP